MSLQFLITLSVSSLHAVGTYSNCIQRSQGGAHWCVLRATCVSSLCASLPTGGLAPSPPFTQALLPAGSHCRFLLAFDPVDRPSPLSFYPHRRPDQPAVMAASMLAFDPVDRLTHDQHLALLRFLCDAVLDTEKMRGILQRECCGSAMLPLSVALRVWCGAGQPEDVGILQREPRVLHVSHLRPSLFREHVRLAAKSCWESCT